MSELIIVAGEPGVGKSFVAKEIAKKRERDEDTVEPYIRINSDEVRKELFNSPDYSRKESELTYNKMFLGALQLLSSNKNVILDATFSVREGVDMAEYVAERTGSEFTIVRVHCNDWSVIKQRLQEREQSESDADLEIHKSIAERFDPIFRERVDIFNRLNRENTKHQINNKL
jgi:predicted kinase